MRDPQHPTNGMSFNVVLDVWGGANSGTHVARMMLSLDEAFRQAEIELAAGYLVNLRAETGWGPEQDFDLRAPNGAN